MRRTPTHGSSTHGSRSRVRAGALSLALGALALGACAEATTSGPSATTGAPIRSTLGSALGSAATSALAPLVGPVVVDRAVGTWECHRLRFRNDDAPSGTTVETGKDYLLVEVVRDGTFRYAKFENADLGMTYSGDGTWELDGGNLVTRIDNSPRADFGYDAEGVALDAEKILVHEVDYPEAGSSGAPERGLSGEVGVRVEGDTRVELTFDERSTFRCDKTERSFAGPGDTTPAGKPPSTARRH